MRTNVVLDDDLIGEALTVPGIKTKRAAIEAGLRLLVQLKRQSAIRRFRGKLRWTGDLARMRSDR